VTVQAAGQNSGRGCLAAASWPTEQIGVVDSVGRQCPHQGVGDLGLTDELSKGLRSISSIESSHHALSLPGTYEYTPVARKEKTPRAPTRAQLPLLRFRPGGVSQVSATRGATPSLSLGWNLRWSGKSSYRNGGFA